MRNYDFNNFNDKEFESLCCDLLGAEFGRRFERFKPGKDSGVDGRFFSPSGGEVILQCKHWPATPTEKMISDLGKKEAPKAQKLRPERYLLAVSKPLSRNDKHQIRSLFGGCIQSADDIFGREDLNDLLGRNREAELSHYKLWIHSADVLAYFFNKGIYDRSQFALEEIIESSKRYVRTVNHDNALELAEKLGVVILAGEPGIGKTSLAEQLCLHYVGSGYELFKVSRSMAELEQVFQRERKQVFYFDDFLGRNYLEALGGHEGSEIVHFIRRVKRDQTKRFILTSRSTILNRGKQLMDVLTHNNLEKNEYVLTISGLSELDKAKILYNHIWFSGLPDAFKDEIYVEKRYRKIVAHQNFNPRLVSFITDPDRLTDRGPVSYWNRIEASFENPADVWEHPFTAQHNDLGRAIVLLTTINGRRIDELDLSAAFSRYVQCSPNLSGDYDFVGLMRQLTGSLLSRTLDQSFRATIDLFNPALGDYVLRRYIADVNTLELAALSLRSTEALQTLDSLAVSGLTSKVIRRSLLGRLLDTAHAANFTGYGEDYIAALTWSVVREIHDSSWPAVIGAIEMLSNGSIPHDCTALAKLLAWAAERRLLPDDRAIRVVAGASGTETRDEGELRALSSLLYWTDDDAPGRQSAHDSLKADVLYLVADVLTETIWDESVLSGVGFEEYSDARSAVRDHVGQRLSAFKGVTFRQRDVDEIVDNYDVSEQLDEMYRGSSRGSTYRAGAASADHLASGDAIDDLFERD